MIGQNFQNSNRLVRGLEQPALSVRTIPYAAPELFAKLRKLRSNCDELDKKIDVYAFAITLLDIVTRQAACKSLIQSSGPNKNISNEEFISNVTRGSRPTIEHDAKVRLEAAGWACVPVIITQAWKTKPEKRPSFFLIHQSILQRKPVQPVQQIPKHRSNKSSPKARNQGVKTLRKMKWPLAGAICLLATAQIASGVQFICPEKHHITGVRTATTTFGGRTVIGALRFVCSNGAESTLFGSNGNPRINPRY